MYLVPNGLIWAMISLTIGYAHGNHSLCFLGVEFTDFKTNDQIKAIVHYSTC